MGDGHEESFRDAATELLQLHGAIELVATRGVSDAAEEVRQKLYLVHRACRVGHIGNVLKMLGESSEHLDELYVHMRRDLTQES